MAFGDADGTIHMMSSSAPNDEEELQPLNGFEGQRIEWADITFPIPEVDWDAKTWVDIPYTLVTADYTSAP
jgi:PAB-dependent poly(A)-specific ribonuclease subunit 2